MSSSVSGQQNPLASRSRAAKFTRFRPSVGFSGARMSWVVMSGKISGAEPKVTK